MISQGAKAGLDGAVVMSISTNLEVQDTAEAVLHHAVYAIATAGVLERLRGRD